MGKLVVGMAVAIMASVALGSSWATRGGPPLDNEGRALAPVVMPGDPTTETGRVRFYRGRMRALARRRRRFQGRRWRVTRTPDGPHVLVVKLSPPALPLVFAADSRRSF